MKTLNLRMTVRVEEKQRKQIDQAISEGRAKSVSELTRNALAEFLKQIPQRETKKHGGT